MKKRTIYFANRIKDTKSESIILINNTYSVSDLKNAYSEKKIENKKFIHNGHWVMKPASCEQVKVALPRGLSPLDVVEMILGKILSSEVIVAEVNSESYGTIVELGYAAGTNNKAVYVLPSKDLPVEEINELWMSFWFSVQTKAFWREEDIINLEVFKRNNIFSISDYENFIRKIIPNFLIN